MKIFLGSLQQETNTFSTTSGSMKDFDFIEGPAMLRKIAATPVFAGADLVPSYYANAIPSGRLSKDLFKQFVRKMIDYAKNGGPFDGVWLYLHGSMDAGMLGSGEIVLLKALRDITGYDIPYAVALDFHANNNPDIIKYANIICGYRTAPHSDMAQTQIKAAELLVRSIKDRVLPRSVLITIPAIITGDMVITANHPMKDITMRLDDIEREDPDILSISLFNGHNWVDSTNNHASVIAVTMQNVPKALTYAREIAYMFWNAKEEFSFQIEALSPCEALIRSIEIMETPVFVSDSGDNTTAGAPGNSTYLLREAIQLKMMKTLFGAIHDTAAYNKCKEFGVGGHVDLSLGNCSIDRYDPLLLNVDILDIREILGWDNESAGGAALVRTGGIDIIITERRTAFTTPAIFMSAGVDITKFHTCVVKLGYLYPKLAEVAGKALIAKTPGISCIDVKSLGFTNVERPIYPLDEITEVRFSEYV